MDALQERWRLMSRGTLHESATITDLGVVLGFDTVLVRRATDGYDLTGDAERLLCLLSITQRRPQQPRSLYCLRRALACWEQGNKALAHIHLAFGRLPRVENVDDAWRLHQAGGLIDLGMAPRILAKELGFELPSASLSKYDENQLRNPAGSGRVSGQWAKDPVAAGSIAWAPEPQPNAPSPVATAGAGALALRPTAPSLVDALGAEALEWLAALAEGLTLPAAVFGTIFVPSPTSGTSEAGEVPGHPGLSYALDHDTGTLRLSQDSNPDPDDALVAQLGADGIYRDVETKVPIARAVGSSAVLIDLAQAPAIADSITSDDDQPKLCPAPSNDQGGGRKLFDVLYEQYVRDFVNPQRRPQLAPGLAFALPANTKSGWVHYDDCREATGAMIDAKGNYADFMSKDWGEIY